MYSVEGHLNDHGSAMVQYEAHCPMGDDQGYIGSHWTPPLGNYLLRNVPAAARVTGKATMMTKDTLFAGNFDGHGNALVH